MTEACPTPPSAPPTRAWSARLSLRTRLLAVIAALLAIALIVAGALTVATVQLQLRNRVDDQLRQFANPKAASKVMSDLLSSPATSGEGSAGPAPGGQAGGHGLPSVFAAQLFTDSGGVSRVFSQNPDRGLPNIPTFTSAKAAGTDAKPFTLNGTQGTHWRAIAVPYDDLSVNGTSIGPATIVLATPLTDAEHTVSGVLWAFTLLSIGLLAALMVVGYFAIGRAFRPLRVVEGVAVAFGRGDTNQRVPDQGTQTEVGRLGTSMNAMLDQIETTLAAREASEQRMRRFVGDASHELRTPLSTVRGFAELYRMGAVRNPEDISQTFRRIEDESTRMAGLVEDLLRLARLDEQRPLNLTSVDLLVLVADAEQDAKALDRTRLVRVTGLDGHGEPGPALVTGDEQQLRQVVTNLMANALRHTAAGTPVELGVGTRDGQAVLHVVDHGHGVDPEVAEKIFERFFRADASRSRGSGGGSGLGLAIVASIVEAHHGHARVLPTTGGGATFEVTIPARRAGLSDNSQTRSSSSPVRTP